MIHLYKKSNTNYKKNGDYIIDIKAVITRDLNNSYTLNINTFYEGKITNIDYNMVIKAEDNNISQLFRVNSININNDVIDITAIHIYTDLLDHYIDKLLIKNMTRVNALKYCLNNTLFENRVGENKFTISNKSEDTEELGSLEIENNNILNLINTDSENTLKKVYGGEYDFDNFEIIVKNRIGSDRGYLITDSKNLESFEQNIDCSNVITRIMPESTGGLRLDELYVDSPNFNKYNKVYFAHITFDEVDFEVLPPENQDKEYSKRKKEAQNKLRELAIELFKKDKVDIPIISYNVSLDDLRYDRRYRKISHLLNLNLGDLIRVHNNKLNISLTQRVVSTVYEVGTAEEEGRYTEITLSNLEEKFSSQYSKETSIISKSSNENNGGLSGRVEELEKGFSEVEQKWDKVEFRFSTSSINKVKNGAFIKNSDFWTFSNSEFSETESNFDYERLNKDDDFQTSALKITSKLLNTEEDKAFALSDKFELKTGRNYTLSFKIKLDENINSATISFIKRVQEDDIEIEEQVINIFKSEGKKYINEKFFVDFKTDELNKIYRIKITNDGLINSTLENNSVVITEIMLTEGYGYKAFDYNDAILDGITQIDANGVLVKHTNANTMSRMDASGFRILDKSGTVLGSFGDSAEYVNLYADKVYASNIKQSIINTNEIWEISNGKDEFNKYISTSIYKVLSNDFICAKNRINSELTINDRRTSNIIDNIEITDMDGSEININLSQFAWYSGNIIIKNCTSKVVIAGVRGEYTDNRNGTKFSGQIIINNCQNVVIKELWIQSIDSDYSLMKHDTCFDIKDSKVMISSCNIQGYMYLGNAIDSEVTFDYVTGRATKMLNGSNLKLWLGKFEDSNDMYIPDYTITGDSKRGSCTIACGDGQIIKKEVSEIESGKPPLIRWTNNYVSEITSVFQAYNYEQNSKVWKHYTDSQEKLIQGVMELEDGTKENWLGAFEIYLDRVIKSYLSNEGISIESVLLKFRLKTKNFTTNKYDIGIATFKGDMNNKSFSIVKDYGVVGTAMLVKDNYINLNSDIIKDLVSKEITGLCFTITDKDNKECIFIDARSINLIVVLKDITRSN